MLRYALYARWSKDDRSGAMKSIEDQKRECLTLAESLGLHVAKNYEENKTARTPGVRSIYRSMISDIRHDKIDAILVWHVNRLARNMEEAGALSQMLIDAKVKEIRAMHAVFRPGDNILQLLLEQGTATQYSLDLSQAVARGIKSSAEAGGWPHLAPVGYRNERDPANPRRGLVHPDTRQWPLVQRSFTIMLTGSYTVSAVAQMMYDWGLRRRATKRLPERPVSRSHAYEMFSNPFYAGFTVHKGVIRKGNHQALITATEFNRLQQILQTQRRQTRRRRREFAYTGLITCDRCGMQVTAEWHHKSGKDRVYYHCSDPYRACTKRGITEEALEARVIALLQSVTLDEELCRLAWENIDRWSGRQTVNVEAVVAEQRARMGEIDLQRRNLLLMTASGKLTDESLYEQTDRDLVGERNRLEAEVARAKEAQQHIRTQARSGLRYIEHGLARFSTASPARKREIAAAIAHDWRLNIREMTMEIEPALKRLVAYAQQLSRSRPSTTLRSKHGPLEPQRKPDLRSEKARVGPSVWCGRDPKNYVDPPPELIAALEGAHFPDLFGEFGLDLPAGTGTA